MSEENPRLKKLITWKDADQNICTLAASMLQDASAEIRSPLDIREDNAFAQEIEGVPEKGAGFAEDKPSRRRIEDRTSRSFFWDVVDPRFDDKYPGVCWWSFQNIIRQELAECRQEIQDNLYSQDRPGKRSKQSTRNKYPGTRPQTKYGRKPER